MKFAFLAIVIAAECAEGCPRVELMHHLYPESITNTKETRAAALPAQLLPAVQLNDSVR